MSAFPDGSIALVGVTTSSDGDVTNHHSNYDFWVVKLDPQGALLWQRDLGGSEVDEPQSLCLTSNGGIVAVGGTRSVDGDVSGYHTGEFMSFDGWVVCLSPSGSLQWQRCLGGSQIDWTTDVQQTADGGFVIVGWTWSTDGDVSGTYGQSDGWVVKLNSSGDLQWQQRYGGSGQDEIYSLQELPDGDFVFTGRTSSIDGDIPGNHGIFDAWVGRISSTGSLIWSRTYGGSQGEVGLSVQGYPNGDPLVVGYTNSNDGDVNGFHGMTDTWVLRLDADGDIIWQTCMGGSGAERGYDALVANDHAIISGSTSSTDIDIADNHGATDGWLVDLDQNGSIAWQKCYGGTLGERFVAIDRHSDGYVAFGESGSVDGDGCTEDAQYGDFWVVGLGDGVGVEEEYDVQGPTVRFDELTSQLLIQGSRAIMSYAIYASDGRVIQRGKIRTGNYAIDMNPAQGLYLVQVYDESTMVDMKFFVP